MPVSHRHTDFCTGHGCFPPRPNAEGSPNVFINGLAQHREGDDWETHCCGPPCHSSTAANGSPNVFANNKAACRLGDDVDCGSIMATGSPDVIING